MHLLVFDRSASDKSVSASEINIMDVFILKFDLNMYETKFTVPTTKLPESWNFFYDFR